MFKADVAGGFLGNCRLSLERITCVLTQIILVTCIPW